MHPPWLPGSRSTGFQREAGHAGEQNAAGLPRGSCVHRYVSPSGRIGSWANWVRPLGRHGQPSRDRHIVSLVPSTACDAAEHGHIDPAGYVDARMLRSLHPSSRHRNKRQRARRLIEGCSWRRKCARSVRNRQEIAVLVAVYRHRIQCGDLVPGARRTSARLVMATCQLRRPSRRSALTPGGGYP